MAGWLHGVCVGECFFVFPLCGCSLSLFCNYIPSYTGPTTHHSRIHWTPGKVVGTGLNKINIMHQRVAVAWFMARLWCRHISYGVI